ncbi:F-box domain-containing protein [Mycena venus]|uniref:F-box domain-containing protein n=1 Tax=Mycena venus TaxID=2733690 RepID=A0A8H6YPS0_9AGAR|nr:F-box domain-containing protein [Mycena venus]
MSDNLPDEIISEILSPALKVSETLFSDTSLESPFAFFFSSSSSTLLVCKSWLRVATPLLYHFVVIRSKAQANAFQATLRGNPDLGRFVKNLRVEGGFGKSMHHILKKTPNINHLVLCLHLRAADSTDGLAEGLSLINPIRLTIIDEIDLFLNNKGVTKLMKAIEGSLQKWNRLNEVELPYTRSMSTRESFCLAVCSSPTVTTVSLPDYNSSLVPTLVKIAQNPSIKAIHIRPESQQKPPRAERNHRLRVNRPPRAPPQVTDPRLRALIRWSDASIGGPDAKTLKVVSMPKNPSFRPAASTPPEIWARILSFAMLSLEQHPTNVEPSKLLDQNINSGRLQFLLVSHSFQYPVLPNEHILASFAAAVVANPTLGKRVQLLDLRIPNRRHILGARVSAAPSLQASLHLILPHTCNLRRLICTDSHRSDFLHRPTTISWGDFTTLAETAGNTLQEFTGFAFTFPQETTVLSPTVFNHFVALQKFTWKCGFRSNKITFHQVDQVSASALPALEFLDIRTPEALLPSLQRIALANEQKGYGQDHREWHNSSILSVHSTKIQHLEVFTTTIDNKSIFALCPSMMTLTWRPPYQSDGQYVRMIIRIALKDGFTHSSINKIILIKANYGRTIKENDENWDKLFSALHVPHLPALSEVSVPWCEWPKTDHEIAKSMWVKWAEIFLERGVKMTGKDGTEWRPRLKTSRRR